MPEESVVPATDMYPSLDELLTSFTTFTEPLPTSLIASLSHRYNQHGMEYASSAKHPDGRIINKCMQKDSILDAKEELNDAIFNLLVAHLKQELGYEQKGIRPWTTRAVLNLLLLAWTTLSP